MQAHEHWMRICLELAEQALSTGNPPVGSLIVRDGEIIGRGAEAGKSKNDITYHAEIEAIRSAVASTQSRHLLGCVLYTTHEPCIMCAYAIRHYRISCVVIGTTVPHIGGYSSAYPILTASDIPIWTTPPLIVTGVCQEICEQLSHLYQNPTYVLVFFTVKPSTYENAFPFSPAFHSTDRRSIPDPNPVQICFPFRSSMDWRSHHITQSGGISFPD